MTEIPDSDVTAPQPRPSSIVETTVRLLLTLLLLYLFLVGIKFVEVGIGLFGGDFVDGIFENVSHPLAGLAAGILSTAIIQSSSVTTSTLVGLVGAGVLGVEAAVPMVMGANIGTTVTATLASLGHIRQGPYFRRAFAASTVHDYFNLLSVLIFLPLEIWFHVVSGPAKFLASVLSGVLPGTSGETGWVKSAIQAPVDAFSDAISGWGGARPPIMLILGVLVVFLALWQVTRLMKRVLSSRMESAINRMLGKGAGVGAIFVGMIFTIAVQSSSITTSMLVPLAAAGVLTIKNVYPVGLGADVGTTFTALLASLATNSPDALVIALTHTWFNVIGILAFYPIPFMRRIPIALAEWTAKVATERKILVAVYVIGVFFVTPVVILFVT